MVTLTCKPPRAGLVRLTGGTGYVATLCAPHVSEVGREVARRLVSVLLYGGWRLLVAKHAVRREEMRMRMDGDAATPAPCRPIPFLFPF